MTPPVKQASNLFQGVEFDDVMNCIHCGLCLDTCPTYRELGAEQDSPRGRIYLMRALWEEELTPEPEVLEPLERCLDCRACETVCPSKVTYGSLLEKTRAAVFNQRAAVSPWLRFQRKCFDWIFSGQKTAVWMSRLGWAVRVFGLQKAFLRLGFSKILPKSWSAAMRLMPHFEGSSFKQHYRANQDDIGRKTVALFTGCVMDVADHEIHTASIALLETAGFQVAVPKEQYCCGALHAHKGFQESAKSLAESNSQTFRDPTYSAILVNAAGCAAHMKHQLIHEASVDSGSPKENYAWEHKVKDLLSLLSMSDNWRPEHFSATPPITVLYDAPCHQIHAQKSDALQREFLNQVPGVTVVPIKNADRCCGAGGIYNVTQPDLSQAVLKGKLHDLEQSLEEHPFAEILLTANPGCLYQWRAGVSHRKLPIQVKHPAVFLASRLAKKGACEGSGPFKAY